MVSMKAFFFSSSCIIPDRQATPSSLDPKVPPPESPFIGTTNAHSGAQNGVANRISESVQRQDAKMVSLTISSPLSPLLPDHEFPPSITRLPSLHDQQLEKKREPTKSAAQEASSYIPGISSHEISPDATDVKVVRSQPMNTTRLSESIPEAPVLTQSIASGTNNESILPTLSSVPVTSTSSKEITVQGHPKLRDPLELVVRTRFFCDHQTREERVDPVLLANLSLSCLRGTGISEEPELNAEGVIREVMKGPRFASLVRGFGVLRPSLVDFVSQRRTLVNDKIRHLREDYVNLQEKWKSHCHKLNEQAKPSIFEGEAMPIGRTTRRTANLGDTVRSDLEMEQILASLESNDLSDPHYLSQHNLATIPDMVSVKNGKIDYLFDDTCHRVENPAEYYAPQTGIHDWTEEEKKTFLDKYASHPKQFGIIANHLPNKTSSQCVDYYYLHKKGLIDFRKVVSKFGSKRRRRGAGKRKGNALLTDIQKHDEEVNRDVGSKSISTPSLVSGRRGRKGRDKEKEKDDERERERTKEKEEREKETEKEKEEREKEKIKEKEKTKEKEEKVKEKTKEEKTSVEAKLGSERKGSARVSGKRNAAQMQDKASTGTPTPEPETKGRRKRVIASVSVAAPFDRALSLNSEEIEDTPVSSFSFGCRRMLLMMLLLTRNRRPVLRSDKSVCARSNLQQL